MTTRTYVPVANRSYEPVADPVDIDTYVHTFWKDDVVVWSYLQDSPGLVAEIALCKTSHDIANVIVDYAHYIYLGEKDRCEFDGVATFIEALDLATLDWVEEQVRDAEDRQAQGYEYFSDRDED